VRATVTDEGGIQVELDVRSTTDLLSAGVRIWEVSGAVPVLVAAACDTLERPTSGTRRQGTWVVTCVPDGGPDASAHYLVTPGPLRAASGAVAFLDPGDGTSGLRSSTLRIGAVVLTPEADTSPIG
jgi:hypothetical protein